MDTLTDIYTSLGSFLPSAATIAGVIIALFVIDRLLEKGQRVAEGHRFRNQLIMVGLTFIGIVIVILVIPVSDTLRGQLLSLIGILVTAAIALSSTTFLGNALAGVMLRAVRNFRMGDFIRVEEHFGRVSERGLFHTEIQTEERELKLCRISIWSPTRFRPFAVQAPSFRQASLSDMMSRDHR